MFRIQDVIKLLTRIFVKENKRFPKGLEGVDIRLKAKKIYDVGKAGNYTGGISENQLKHFLALEKQAQGPTIRGHKIISGDSPEGKKITEDLFGKKGEVIKVDFDKSNKWFKGKSEGVEDVSFAPGKDKTGKIVVESPSQIIARMKKMTPIEAMAEASSVIGRKGKYKNLTEKQSKKILKDTEDHIFERDIPDEDFADGGVAGLLGERTGFKRGTKKSKKKEFRFPPPWMGPSIHQREESHQVPDRVNAWGHGVNFPYKSLEDIPPDVLAMLMKDPVFDLETFLKKVAWSDPDKTRIQKRIRRKGTTMGCSRSLW